MKRDDSTEGGKSVHSRPQTQADEQAAHEIDSGTETTAIAPASSLEQIQSFAQTMVGNTELTGALSGAATGPWVDAIAGALALETAGVEGQGAQMVSNQVMCRAMRDANDISAEAGVALKRLQTGGGRGLPAPVRARMEAAFGQDFSHVRIHVDQAAEQAAQSLQAHAFATGADLYFGRGEFRPGTQTGDRLIAHELTHVVQADEGRLPSSGGVSSPTDSAEVEAYANETVILDRLRDIEVGTGFTSEPELSASSLEPLNAHSDNQSSQQTVHNTMAMRAEKEGNVEGACLAVEVEEMDDYYDQLGTYVGFDLADAILQAESDYQTHVLNAQAMSFFGKAVVPIQNAGHEADDAYWELFYFVNDLNLQGLSDEQEQGETNDREGLLASNAEIEALLTHLVLTDAHMGKIECVSALLIGPAFQALLRFGSDYLNLLADYEMFRALGQRTRDIQNALRRAEAARMALLAEKTLQLGVTITAALTAPLVAAAAAAALAACGVTAPIWLAAGAFVATVGYASTVDGLFGTPDLGAMFTGVRGANTANNVRLEAFEAIENTGKIQETFSKTKIAMKSLRNPLAVVHIGAAAYELAQACVLELDGVERTIERWEERWPDVLARYQSRIDTVRANQARTAQITAMLPGIEADLAEHQAIIDELGIG
jgi:hypothetical protein